MPFDMKKINELIGVHISKGKMERHNWDKYHAWYLSEFWDNKSGGQAESFNAPQEDTSQISLETNYPYPYIDTMIANVCPTNPLLSIKPRDPDMAKSAQAREALVNDSFKRDKMHAKSWDLCSHTGICGRGFSKTVWDADRRCPTTSILDPRTVFFDMTKPWEHIRYICEVVILDDDEFRSRVRVEADPPGAAKYDPAVAAKVKPGAYPSWLEDKERSKAHVNEATKSLFQWHVVYEFYDLRDNVFYHVYQDQQEPLYKGALPNRFVKNPFAMIVFNTNLRDPGGVSDVKLIAPLQERLNELDSLELWFAKSCIPALVLNESKVDNPEDARSAVAQGSQPGSIISLKVKSDVLLEQVLRWTPTPALSPQHSAMRDRCTQVIEFILGLPQYARGAIGKGGDTATEFALADAALRTRNGRRIKVVEDWIGCVGQKVLGIWKEKIDPEKSMSIPRPYANDTMIVSRAELAFPTPADTINEFEDEYNYNYEVVPYSPTENHKLVQLQKLQQFWPVIQGMLGKGVDTAKFVTKLLELLGLPEMQMDGAPAVPPPAPAVAGAQGGGGDTLATGAMPAGTTDVESILPPGVRGQASQPGI